MKRALSILLTAVLLLSGLRAYGFDGSTATPPAWVAAEDYLIFPGDPVYDEANWAEVERLRQAAENGALLPREGREWAQGSPGQCYETGLLRLKYAANAGDDPVAVGEALLAAGKAFSAAESGWVDQNRKKDELAHRLAVEKYRAYLAYHPAYVENWGRGIVPALDALAMGVEKFFDAPFLDRVSGEGRAAVEESIYGYWEFYLEQRNLISVYLDDGVLLMDTLPQVKDQRTMVPIRAVAEALGAEVKWTAESNQVTMTRAGSTVVMALGSTVAMVDGVPIKMDVAPYADQNRTYLPVRYVAEFFGQKVEWDQDERRVDISEDKSAYADTNLEDWAKPMGALLSLTSGGDPNLFGGYCRAPHPNGRQSMLVEPAEVCRQVLLEQWSISDREELLAEVEDIRDRGHNQMFIESAREVRNMSAAQVRQYTSGKNEVDQYMWPQTRKLWLKWGTEKGIRAWDLCRSVNMAQWGYTAGYLTYAEAMDVVAATARELSKIFSSWDEVYENFADGYYWCVREDMTGTDVWESDFGMAYQALRSTIDLTQLFDDSLFETGVKGLK